jgi:hypothetical protein
MGREGENLTTDAGEPPSAAGAYRRRVPRLADYTGGLIVVRERKGSRPWRSPALAASKRGLRRRRVRAAPWARP